MATKQAATWNRDDRDLLVELRTNMQNIRNEVAEARIEIKDINTGISARLLTLEGNAVSKIQISGFDDRISVLEKESNQWIGKQQAISGFIGIVVSLVAVWLSTGKI